MRSESFRLHRIAVLLEALGIQSLMHGFEAPVRQAWRMRQE